MLSTAPEQNWATFLTLKMIVATKEELTHKVQHLVNCKEHFISVINTRLIAVAYGFFYSLYAFFQEKKNIKSLTAKTKTSTCESHDKK